MQFLTIVFITVFITESFLNFTVAQEGYTNVNNNEEEFSETTENPNRNTCENSHFLVAGNSSANLFVNGDNITLVCKPKVPARCFWSKNGIATAIGKSQRYHYCDTNNGIHTFDCSIYIIHYKEGVDSGNWSCRGAAFKLGHPEQVTFEHFILQGSASTDTEAEYSPDSTTAAILDIGDAQDSTTVTQTTHNLNTQSSSTTLMMNFENTAIQNPEENLHTPMITATTAISSGTPMITATAAIPSGMSTAELKLVEHPQNATINIGSEHTFKCVFNINTNCSWKKTGQNDVDIKPDGRHVYPNGENGENTKDCSLRLTDARVEDTGNWICTSSDVSAVSSHAYLTVIPSETTAKSINFVEQPKGVTLRHNETSVALKCVFDSAVEICEWKKDGNGQAMWNNYQFISGQNGRNTTDCSMRINVPQKLRDEGCWTCRAIGESNESNAACLQFQGSPPTTRPTQSSSTQTHGKNQNVKGPEDIEKEVAEASNSAVTVAVSCVVVSLVGIAITIFLCMYKRKKYIFAPKSGDVQIQTEFPPKRPRSSAQLEESLLLRASMNSNGKSHGKISESDASNL